MMDENNLNQNQAPQPYTPPAVPNLTYEFPTQGRELIYAAVILVASMLLCNFTLYGGFRLGFAIGTVLCILCTGVYLVRCGHKLTPYSAMLLGLSLVIAAGFARSGDAFVKFVMLCFLFVSVNLGFTLLSGRQRHAPGGFSSLWDAFYTAFAHSLRMSPAFSGLRTAFLRSGSLGRKGGAILTGLAVAVPLLFIMVFLLMRADAAFEGLMDLLPEFNFPEIFGTVLFGALLASMLYTKGTSLQHSQSTATQSTARRGVNVLTVNTVLIAVCAVYLVYLCSQLAYFVGGFSGILPEEYTMAEYARRGFFEMAWLCAINLGIIGLSVGLVEKKTAAPRLTRLLCLFISLITVFFVAAASGKMFLYIGSYGLTRLRVLTQVIMLWLCLTTVLVAVWLFVPRMPYMKSVIAAGLIIGAVVFWADVDTVVAGYNVNAYLSGSMESVDVSHLGSLNAAAVPYIAELAQKAPDAEIQEMAQDLLEYWYQDRPDDFRSWSYVNHIASAYLPEYPLDVQTEYLP